MISILTIIIILYICKNNIITIFIAIEVLLLTITLKFISIGSLNNDISPTILGVFIIILAGAESAIGLSILVSYYKLRGELRETI